jgi:hypothetical protein
MIFQQNIIFGLGRLLAHRVAPALLIVILLVTTFCSGVEMAHAGNTLSIELARSSESEKTARVQLRRLVDQFDVEQWLFTEKVLIDDSQWIPHSHPVLTLNSRYLDDDLSQLATFLHEQFHWYAGTRQERIDAAISDFKAMFPEVPSGRVGARDEYSTYLHLIICDLELAAMQKLVGDAEARRVLGQWQHYTWIYDQVLNNSAVRAINEYHELTPP